LTNLSAEPIENSIIYKKEIVEILDEIKRVCRITQSNCIKKHGRINSLESICKTFQSGLFSTNKAIEDLISRKSIIDVGDYYKIRETKYITQQANNKEYIDTLSTELFIHTNTMLNNKDADKNYITHFQMRIYSTQINPNKFEIIKGKIVNALREAYTEVEELLEEHEETVPLNTYPQIGACFFGFDEL
jgi:hypothetical protein